MLPLMRAWAWLWPLWMPPLLCCVLQPCCGTLQLGLWGKFSRLRMARMALCMTQAAGIPRSSASAAAGHTFSIKKCALYWRALTRPGQINLAGSGLDSDRICGCARQGTVRCL